MRFTKMHGAGNDYVYVNCFDQPVPDNPADLARRVSDRHFGIGGDGLILICRSETADAGMRMFNADGSESEMCGNGIRCLAKFVYDHRLVKKRTLSIETGAGILSVDLELEGDLVNRARVDMGEPILDGRKIPTTFDGDPVVGERLTIADTTMEVVCVSMGNPHCIIFVDELTDEWVLEVGPKVEVDAHFPNRVNAEFVRVKSRDEVEMRVWERGSGETLACGTGACAVCVAGALTERTDRRIVAHLPGGDLELYWAEDNHVYLTGPATEVFSGKWND